MRVQGNRLRLGGGLVIIASVLQLLWTACTVEKPDPPTDGPGWGMVIHGGAGTILRENMSAEVEAEYRQKMSEALRAGYDILKEGGSSLDAIQAAINIMEDSPLFNAGKGAVFTHAGTNELDASIMDGRTLNAGAVAGVTRVKNPINLARLVMEKSRHVMLSGSGAEAFARRHDVELVEAGYFHTDRRWNSLQRALEKEKQDGGQGDAQIEDYRDGFSGDDHKFGTVGAVALDQAGNLAAGTSTGGMTNKRWGRIGDSPVIGAGTYANNASCAVSATGHGEYFLRGVISHDIAAMMRYGALPVKAAAEAVIMKKLGEMGGTGGVIVMDHQGNIAMPFNTSGMYRGYVDKNGRISTAIYNDEPSAQ